MAYAAKYKNTKQVVLCFFGEAAVNQGMFHESLNMAQLWKLPCIYICENNQYGMGTSQERAMSSRSIAMKADAFEMANEFVDGMDVMAVRDATQRAIERARKDSLPTLLEIRAYRYMGHSMSDPGNYRTRDEILSKIWGLDPAPTNRTVDNFIVKLRKKIERSPDKPQHILTVYGFGYKLAM